jgi:catalase-peroxidase
VSESHTTVETKMNTEEAGGCPVHAGRLGHPTEGAGNTDWWPNQLNLRILAKNPADANPLGDQFNYAEAF